MKNPFKNLFGKKQSEIFSEEELKSAGACPNCWGHQDYDGEYLQFVEDQTKSNINHDKSNQKAFIAQFVEERVSGIKLRKVENKLSCPVCTA